MAFYKIHEAREMDLFSASTDTPLELPVLTEICAGFPSPAADFVDTTIDFNRDLLHHPAATFYARVKGESMKDAGIDDGDLLVIDKSITPADGKIAVCFIDGEFTLKRIKVMSDGIYLMPANRKFHPIRCTEENDLRIWGVVSYVIKPL